MSSPILLLGALGYVGQAFEAELRSRQWSFRSLSRSELDYSRFDVLLALLRSLRPSFLINCAGYTGKPNVDACELAWADTFAGNAILPQTIAHACEIAGVPWGHVSSGCIYSGAKVSANGAAKVYRDMTDPEFQRIYRNQRQTSQ